MRKALLINRIIVTIFLDCLHLSVIHMPLILHIHMPYTDEKVFILVRSVRITAVSNAFK